MSSKKKDDEKTNNSGINTVTIIGIIVGVVVLALIAFAVYYKYNSDDHSNFVKEYNKKYNFDEARRYTKQIYGI